MSAGSQCRVNGRLALKIMEENWSNWSGTSNNNRTNPIVQLPKNPSSGSVHMEFKRCGKTRCRCLKGLLHGPYVYRHWRNNHRQHKAYVPMSKLCTTLQALELYRAQRPRPTQVRRILRELEHEH
jgi:hypothetical protein